MKSSCRNHIKKTAWNTTAFSWFLVPNGSPKRPQNLSFFCSGRPLAHTLALKWPRWHPGADFASKCVVLFCILYDFWMVFDLFLNDYSWSYDETNRLSDSWQTTFKIPSKSPQLPKRTKTSRCSGVASAFSIGFVSWSSTPCYLWRGAVDLKASPLPLAPLQPVDCWFADWKDWQE